MNRRHALATIAAPLLGTPAPPAPFDWTGLAYSVEKYVTPQGLIHYGKLKQDLQPLDRTVKALAAYPAAALPDEKAQLSHWINVYNSLIMWSFARDYPQEKNRLKNPLKRAAYFYRRKFPVGGQERSLADIEDNSIRKPFREPRIHFTIVCASASCPWLSREVYTAANLDRKLEEEAARFIGQSRNVSCDPVRRVATVSEIFKWFQGDFGGSEEAVLRFIAPYLKQVPINPPNWRLKYFDYDWSINEVQ